MVIAYQNGKTVLEIAKAVGCSHSTCARILRAHGVKLRGRSGRQDGSWLAMAAACVRLLREGLSHAEIGRRLGLTRAQVIHRVHHVVGPSRTWTRKKTPSSSPPVDVPKG